MVKQMLYIGKASKGKISHTFDTFETSKYQKLHKNHWVIARFEIFGFVRNKLLVTVSLDHPVQSVYDSFSDVGESQTWWRADFQSGSRVLKKVF